MLRLQLLQPCNGQVYECNEVSLGLVHELEVCCHDSLIRMCPQELTDVVSSHEAKDIVGGFNEDISVIKFEGLERMFVDRASHEKFPFDHIFPQSAQAIVRQFCAQG